MVNSHTQSISWQARASFDQVALIAVYDAYHEPIYRYIYRQVGEAETARDLTADVFYRLLRAAQKNGALVPDAKAWLYRTAHNIVIDHYRRQKHRNHLPLNEDIAGGNDNLPNLAERNILTAQVRNALQHLTPDQQQVIALKFLHEMSNREVATVLDKPVGAVKSLQHRAIAALQRQLNLVEEKKKR